MATLRGWCKLESTLLLAIFFPPLSCTLGPLTVKRVGNPVYLFENHWSQGVKCYFEGRPRPQITWYKRIQQPQNLQSHRDRDVTGQRYFQSYYYSPCTGT